MRTYFLILRAGSAIGSLVVVFGAAKLAHAQTVDFTGVNLAATSSAAGENFATPSGVTVNVKLISDPPAA